MSGNKILSLLLLATLVMTPLQPVAETNLKDEIILNSSARSTGVDLAVSDVSFSYTSSSDQLKYQMFSSNHPILNFDRPASLFVVDAVIDVPITIDFTVQNLGSTSSGNFNIIISVIHNEYLDFELHNESVPVNSINGGSSSSGQKTIIPRYSGNHTLRISPMASIVDDNPNNDELMRTFTVAYRYFNCDDLTGWTVGNQWSSNADTSLSEGYACHIGNGQSSTYSSNLNTALITPYMDMSDAISNPTRTNGISFFYTGSILAGDVMKVYSNNNNGIWNEMASVSGTIDQVFTDGANWQTWSVNHAGATSPLIPVQQQNFNQQTQFKFEFTSDAMNNDIGLWMDDIVIVYDQKVKQYEYGVSINGISTNGAVPGAWGQAIVEMTNTGNITETYTPTLSGMPANWNMYYSTTSGVSINPSYGITLQSGETKQFVVNFQPDSLSVQGLYQVTLTGHSNEYNTVQSQLNMQFQVIPDRIPEITAPSSVSACQPGNTCTFEVGITNIGGATDVFDISIISNELPMGWSVALAWSQPSSILSQPGIRNDVLMTFTVPTDALPDSIGKFDLKVISQNDSSRVDILEIELTASMISSAEANMNSESLALDWSIEPGDSRVIYYTIWNNASSQDIFTPSVSIRDVGQWIIEQPIQTNLVVNSGKQSFFSVTVTAPEQSQVGDICPKITPVVTSTRSGAVFSGDEFDAMEISRRDDLSITLIDEPVVFEAGKENIVTIEIQNRGNGPNDANIAVEGLPEDWSWKLLSDTTVIDNPVSLTAIYDLEYIKQISISISPKSTTLAGSIYQYTVMVSSNDGTADYNQSDNEIELRALVSTNHNVVISPSHSQIYTGIGNSTAINATIQNLGNIDESNVMIRAQVSMLGSNIQLKPYFTIGQNGIIFDLDKYHAVNLEVGQIYDLQVWFKIPDNTELGTKIVVQFDVQSSNNSGLIFQSVQTMIEIDYRRSMEVDIFTLNNEDIDESSGARAIVNLSSTSTIEEKYNFNLALPENWQSVCSGTKLTPSGINITNTPGHLQEQFTSTSCEIYPLDGADSGDIIFTLQSEDGVLQWSEVKTYTFNRNSEDSFSMSTNMIASSVAGILGVAIISVLAVRARNRRTYSDEEEVNIKPQSQPSGPPISGPPVSSSAIVSSKVEVPSQGEFYPHNQQIFTTGPPIPLSGLPEGWTHEQWKYYGQKYLDRVNSGGTQ